MAVDFMGSGTARDAVGSRENVTNLGLDVIRLVLKIPASFEMSSLFVFFFSLLSLSAEQ